MEMEHAAMHMSSNSTASHFCMEMGGNGMIMYMDGFRFTLSGGHSCLNLFFRTWTLNTPGKFVAAMIGVFIMAIGVEGIARFRQYVISTGRHLRRSRQRDSLRWFQTPSFFRNAVTLLHGLQALLGYMLMLATMTFSVELLLCVVAGLTTGYAAFFFSNRDFLSSEHVTTNPCCNFLEDDTMEISRRNERNRNNNATQQHSPVVNISESQAETSIASSAFLAAAPEEGTL